MSLVDVARATHFELILALGGRIIVSRETFVEMPLEALSSSTARALSRREVIKRAVRRRRGS